MVSLKDCFIPPTFDHLQPDSHLIAVNQDSGSLVVFQIDQSTGKLKPRRQKLRAYTPVDVEFLPMKWPG